MLNDLGVVLSPSDAFIVKLYTVFDEIFGSVPDINPVEEFNVTPDVSIDPLANEYVIVDSSVAVAERDTETFSLNVPNDPLAVTHTGLAFTYKASGINPILQDLVCALFIVKLESRFVFVCSPRFYSPLGCRHGQ